MQYSTRFLKELPEFMYARELITKETNDEYQSMLRKVRRELSFARRTTRWFRQFQVLYNAYRMIERYFNQYEKVKGTKDGNFAYIVIRTINSILAAFFFTLDHIFWAYMANLHRNKKLINKVGDIADYIYITQSLLTICQNSIELHYLQRDMLALNSDDPVQAQKLAAKRQLVTEVSLESIKNFTDMLVYDISNRPPSSSSTTTTRSAKRSSASLAASAAPSARIDTMS